MPALDGVDLSDDTIRHRESIVNELTVFSEGPHTTSSLIELAARHAWSEELADAYEQRRMVNCSGSGGVTRNDLGERRTAETIYAHATNLVREILQLQSIDDSGLDLEGCRFPRDSVGQEIHAVTAKPEEMSQRTLTLPFSDVADPPRRGVYVRIDVIPDLFDDLSGDPRYLHFFSLLPN